MRDLQRNRANQLAFRYGAVQ